MVAHKNKLHGTLTEETSAAKELMLLVLWH